MAHIVTTLGTKRSDELGLILPHELIFVDLRTWNTPGYARAETEDVLRLMVPQIKKAQAAGVTALVECSTVGVGRRADIDRAVSEATGLPLVIPTGIYREPWGPDWAHAAGEAELTEWMLSELQGEIEDSGALPGGGVPRPYTYLTEILLPKLQAAGVDKAMIYQLTRVNPFRAFAR